ncbi:unnamed protein product [Coregonus sp. 'balchen']|nr:unnamed protein product [Coregonus sp. 'balchen']
MQGLSSRAHAFSVEALVGKTIKRMKEENGKDSSSPGDTETETSPVRQETEEQEEREVRVELQGSDLWTRFHEIGTEMIITKAGRRMFPSLRVKVRNLDPCQQYYIAMDVMPVDSKRYRYVYHSSQWMVAGNTDHSCIAPRLYLHPDSPCVGETWMRQVISFDRVKLTNNEMEDKGHIILQSMHKYKPRVHVIRHDPRLDLSKIPSLPTEGMASFSFPETEFTTVTAYQNQQVHTVSKSEPIGTALTNQNQQTITKLKIDRNPFAKGFRDPGRNSLHSFSIPLCCKTSPFSPFSPISPLPARPYPSPRRYSPLPLVLSALQGKKASGCSALCLQGGVPGHPPSLQPHPLQAPPSPLYCLHRSSLPINAPLAALSRHAKLADSTTDCLLHQAPWHTTINHCL